MTINEERAVTNFLVSSYQIMDILNDKSQNEKYFQSILALIQRPDINPAHLLQLINIVTQFILITNDTTYNELTFRAIIPMYLFSPNDEVFSKVVYLFKIILETLYTDGVYTFFFGQNVDDFLLSKLPNVRQIDKEHILGVFINVSAGTSESTQELFVRGFIQKISIFQNINEKCMGLILESLTNMFSLGPEVIQEVLCRGFGDIAIRFFNVGTFSTKETVVLFLCGILGYIQEPAILNFFVANSLMAKITEYFVVSKSKIFSKVVHALFLLLRMIEGPLTDNPLFSDVNTQELIEMLAEIRESIVGKDSKKQFLIEVEELLSRLYLDD
ncbi:hypothetical protein GPJ56_002415 [Histomonas meleagridis]|uniref:uncharacterized protein n=1 Tax=Histomonas meleagridis TaxID=135588 RepID=UPI00355A1393|nr:hypothetical protein GPJ56_002415 [Histomonas meleagridis]KAH0801854.1 hypothetical protein GO595_005272 [Histomonas meleagridis]